MPNDKTVVSDIDSVKVDSLKSGIGFADLFEVSFSALIILRDGYILEANQKALDLFGYSRDEFIGSYGEPFVKAKYWTQLVFNFDAVTEKRYKIEIITKSGEHMPVLLETNSIGGTEKRYRIGSLTDLTLTKEKDRQLKKREAELLSYSELLMEQKHKYEILFNISFNAYIIHREGRILEVNDMFTQLYGYTKMDAGMMDAFELIVGEKKEIERYKKFISDRPRSYVVRRQVRKDGSSFDAEIIASHEVVKGQRVRVVTIRDISDLVQSERKLRERNHELVEKNRELELVSEEVISSRHTFFESLQGDHSHIDGDLLKDVVIYGKYEYDILTGNLSLSDEVRDIFELYDVEVMVPDAAVLKFLGAAERERLCAEINRATVEHGLVKIELSVSLKAGGVRYVLVQGVIQYSDDDKPVKLLGTVLDVTDRKIIENRLRKQNDHYLKLNEDLIVSRKKAEESERLKTAFFSNMSHEIRTPMNGILGFSSLLLDSDLALAERMEYAKVISDSGKRLLHIVNDILDISKLESDTVKIIKTDVDVNRSLVQLLKLFNKEEKVVDGRISLKLRKGLPDSEAVLRTDDNRLNQIMHNLLSNAIKFTDEGDVSFGYVVEGAMLRFYVKDTGIGIPNDLHLNIFEPFRQVEGHLVKRHGGTGLGLSISRKLSELLGGSMQLESSEGDGSIFSFLLPYDVVRKGRVIKQSVPGVEVSLKEVSDLRLLVAEDDDVNYMFFKSFLGRKLQLVRAVNGLEAVEMVKADPDIDIILMDVKMPKMGGLEAIKLIKAEYPNLPIIVQTAYAMAADKAAALEAGADDYVSKPINRRLLLQKIEKLCADVR